MDLNVCIIDKYFSILKNLGYLDYSTTLHIATYIALQELLYSHEWDDKDKKFIEEYLNDLESSVCIISSCTPCPSTNKGRGRNNTFYYPVSGFLDLSLSSTKDSIVKAIEEFFADYNIFVTKNNNNGNI
nr:MAG TPA: hypothetical protein [Crassvirales sp.]